MQGEVELIQNIKTGGIGGYRDIGSYKGYIFCYRQQ